MAITSIARLGRATLLTLAAGALAVAATGCSLLGDAEGTDASGRRPAGSSGAGQADLPTPTPTGDGTEDDDKSKDTGRGTTTKGADTTGTTSGNGGGASSTGTGSKIVYFRVKQRPACPQGTNLNPIPGRPLVIEWKVTGAHQVELAVDGPGLYNTYGTSGTETFTFSCGGSPGTVEQHMYMLTTVGGGARRTKTITATATVKEISDVGPEPTAPPAGP